MPAATMPAPPISPYGPTMAVKGERCQDNPKPVPGARMEIAAVPLSGGAVVLFRDRDHSFQLEFPRATRQFRIPAQPKEAPLPKATVLGQAASLRVALLRLMQSTVLQRNDVSWVLDQQIPPLRACPKKP